MKRSPPTEHSDVDNVSSSAYPIVLSACAALLITDGCAQRATVPAPRDLAKLLRDRDVASMLDLTDSKLQEHISKEFPDITLRDQTGRPVTLRSVIAADEPTAVFLAGGPCPRTLEVSKELLATGWQVPGYKLITLVKTFNSPELLLALNGNHNVFQCEWPLPSYLTYVRSYPTIFYLDDSRRLTGYYLGRKGEVFLQPPKGDDREKE